MNIRPFVAISGVIPVTVNIRHFAGEGGVITNALDVRNYAGEDGTCIITVAVDVRQFAKLQWMSDTLLVNVVPLPFWWMSASDVGLHCFNISVP